MKRTRKILALLLISAMIMGNMFSTVYAYDASYVDSTSAVQEDIDFDNGDYILLKSVVVPLGKVSVTNGNLLSTYDTVEHLVKCDIEIYQKFGTNNIFTQVTIYSEYFGSAMKICNFHVKVKYTDYTDFGIPPTSRSFTASVSEAKATRTLSGSTTSLAQISGHTICVDVTVSDIVIKNIDSWNGPKEVYRVEEIKIR